MNARHLFRPDHCGPEALELKALMIQLETHLASPPQAQLVGFERFYLANFMHFEAVTLCKLHARILTIWGDNWDKYVIEITLIVILCDNW